MQRVAAANAQRDHTLRSEAAAAVDQTRQDALNHIAQLKAEWVEGSQRVHNEATFAALTEAERKFAEYDLRRNQESQALLDDVRAETHSAVLQKDAENEHLRRQLAEYTHRAQRAESSV